MYQSITTPATAKIISRVVRAAANLSGTPYPIQIVAGRSEAPRLAGRSYYWTTLSGKTEVRHPGAYGYPTLYHASTRRIEVGSEWLAAQGIVTPEHVATFAGAGI